MSTLFSSLSRKSHENPQADDLSGTSLPKQVPQAPATLPDEKTSLDKSEGFEPPPGPPPAYQSQSPSPPAVIVTDSRLLAPYAAAGDPRYKAHSNQQIGSNMGMEAGILMGAVSGSNPVMDMIGGQVLGGMIGQRITQQQQHQYWREQSLQYRAASADGRGERLSPQPPVGGADGHKRSRSEKRAERRMERWDRRAARHDRWNNYWHGSADGNDK